MKSSIKTFTSSTQTLTSAVTPLAIGSVCTDTGCCLEVNGTSNVQVNGSGLYYFAADVTITPTVSGTEIVQLYKDGIALPCAISQTTASSGVIFTTHVETVLCLTACQAVKPQISVRASGATGGANFVSFTAIKLS